MPAPKDPKKYKEYIPKLKESYKGQHPKSEFKKGHIPWNKNMKIDRAKFPHMGHFNKNSEETKRKISEATKLAMANPEIRRKISIGLKGKHIRHSGSFRKGMSPWIIGKHHTEEARMKMKEAAYKRWLNPEYHRRMSEIQKERFAHNPSPRKGVRASLETLRKLSESHKGKPSARKGTHLSEEERKKVSEYTKKAMANPMIREKWLKANKERYLNPVSLEKIKEQSRKTILRLFDSGTFPHQTNTKPERNLKAELIKRGYVEGEDFIHQYKFMNKFMCDFVFPIQKIVVEVYGDFWHANPAKYAGKELHPHQKKDIGRDKSKEAYIKTVDNHSWTYLVLWESDIKKDVKSCVDKIEKLVKTKK